MPLYSPGTFGYEAPPLPKPGTRPPGDGSWAVAHPLTFSGLYNSGKQLYRTFFDEALRHSQYNARVMRRDTIIYHAMRARQMPTAQLSWHIDPDDETNPLEVEAAEDTTRVIESMNFQSYRMHLLEALWFGRYAVQSIFRWRHRKGKKQLYVADFVPVMGDKLRFHWDGSVGVYVHSSYPGEKDSTDFGLAHWLTPEEREQFCVHRHEPEDADAMEGEFAGQVEGVGLRSRLYWFWWMKQNIFAWLMNYLERFSNGLTVYFYDAHNPLAKEEMERAARSPFSSNALIIPRWVQQGGKDVNGVERIEVGTASPELLGRLCTEYFDAEMRRAILGQDLTSDTAPTGLGSGVAQAHQETLSRIVKYDAIGLQASIQRDLISVLYRWNHPGIEPGKFSFEVDDPNTEEMLGNAQVLYEMGAEVDLDHLMDTCKLPKPKPGAKTASKIAPLQPAAVGASPDMVPMAGPGGPDMESMYPPPSEPSQLKFSRRSRIAVNPKLRQKVVRILANGVRLVN